MTVSDKDWSRFISLLGSLRKEASDQMEEYVREYGTEDGRGLVRFANSLLAKYGEGATALTATMYDAIAAAEGEDLPEAEMAELSSYGEVAKAMYGTMKNGTEPERLGATMDVLVKQASADTMMLNAIRDHAEWAWIPMGSETCAFCITLASNGWQRASKETLAGNHCQHIHPHCDCMFAIRHSYSTDYEGYNPDKYLRIYEAADGATPEDKINAIRRDMYAASQYEEA